MGPIVYLWVYTILVVSTTITAFVKSGSFIFKMLWLLYSVIAVSCILCSIFQTQILGNSPSLDYWYDLSDTTLQGYLLLFACTFIALLPFSLLGQRDWLRGFGNQKGVLSTFAVYATLYILMVVIFVALSPSTVLNALNNTDYGSLRSELYSNAGNESTLVLTTNPIASICFRVCNIFKLASVAVAFTFYKENRHEFLGTVLLLSTFGLYYIYASANVARGGFLIYFVCAILVASLFWPYLGAVIKRRLFACLVIMAVLVGTFFMTVTISRFANDGGGGNPVLRNIMFYLGHGPIEFSRITGSLIGHSEGQLILGRLFSQWFGIPYSAYSIELSIGYPQIGPLFITFLGFVFCDFGYLGSISIFTLWALLMRWILSNSKPSRFSTLFILFYYLSFFVTGAFTIGLLEIASVVTYHVIWLLLRIFEDAIFIKDKSQFHSGSGQSKMLNDHRGVSRL